MYKFKRIPLDHQLKVFEQSKNMPVFALLMEQGTGKTKVILDNASYLFEKERIDTLIVVAWPNGVHRNWVDNEIPEDVWVDHQSFFWKSNLNKAKEREFNLKLKNFSGLRIFTFNIEAFSSQKAKEYMLSVIRSTKKGVMFAIDQSACIKNPSAKRTKFLLKVSKLPQLKYKRILDGEPTAEGAEELYTQFKFLDPDILGHKTMTSFKSEYCNIGYFKQIVSYRNIDRLYDRIAPFSCRVLAKDCQDLPPKIYKQWSFDLTDKERHHFDQLKVLNLTAFNENNLDEGMIVENLALVKNMRLQQIASGWFPVDGKILSINETPSRLENLLLLLKEAKGKAIIFSRFKADLELLQRVFKEKAVGYHGSISEDDRAVNKKRFKEDPKVLYLLGHPRSAGIGHTLTEAKHIIYYTNDSSLRLRSESEKRAHRQGLKHHLFIWDLVAKNTGDSHILKCLKEKKKISEAILKDPVSFFMEENND